MYGAKSLWARVDLNALNKVMNWSTAGVNSMSSVVLLIHSAGWPSGRVVVTLRPNTYHAAGVSRRHIDNFATFSKNVKFLNLVMIFRITTRNALK